MSATDTPARGSVGLDVLRAVVSIVACLAAGGVGGLMMTGETWTWYASLNRPALNPPGWVFGPVWTALYIMMGVAAFLVWRRDLRRLAVRAGLGLFAAQLLLNAIWTPVFFGLQDPPAALIVIGLLWVAIAATIVVFWRVSKAASILLMPYILWVSFASYLNYAIVTLNR